MNDISLHILDIVQNSIVAGASLVYVEIEEDINADSFLVTIIDNGKGIQPEMLDKVTDAFVTSRTTRKVGLGLPLLKQNAEQCGGWLKIESKPNVETVVLAKFQHCNIDRPPLGDIAGVICLLITGNPLIDFVYKHKLNEMEYELDSREVKKALGDVSVSEPDVYGYLKEMIISNLTEIGVLKENS